MEYTRDLGFYAAKFLEEGGSGALVSIEDGKFKPLYLKDLIDAKTGKMAVRYVDVNGEGYKIARQYMIQLTKRDFEDAHELAKFAATAGISLDQFRADYGYLVENEPAPITLLPGAKRPAAAAPAPRAERAKASARRARLEGSNALRGGWIASRSRRRRPRLRPERSDRAGPPVAPRAGGRFATRQDELHARTDRFEKLWTPAERQDTRQAQTPLDVQDFLNTIPYSPDGFLRSARSVMRDHKGHCCDGAFFAAAAMRRLGHPPLLVDLRACATTTTCSRSSVIAVLGRGGQVELRGAALPRADLPHPARAGALVLRGLLQRARREDAAQLLGAGRSVALGPPLVDDARREPEPCPTGWTPRGTSRSRASGR